MDYMSTSPVEPSIATEMQKYLCIDGIFGNPASDHCFGMPAQQAVEKAQQQVANTINADAHEIIWTSCATEANDLAIHGTVAAQQHRGKHIISSLTEHKSVLKPLQFLEKQGFKVTYLSPEKNGIINAEQVKNALRDDTILISIMHVNNEIGVIQDISSIGKITRERGITFHVDAVQSMGRLPIDVKSMNVDLMVFSAHKIYGPKGVGVLYHCHKPRIRLIPRILGGGQQNGLRSGTLAPHLIVGAAHAFEFARNTMQEENNRLAKLFERFLSKALALGDVHLNGDGHQRVKNNLNLCFEGIASESLMLALSHVAISAGSACNTMLPEASHVLKAIGLSTEQAQSSLRFSLGHYTTEQEVDEVCACLAEFVPKLRSLSP